MEATTAIRGVSTRFRGLLPEGQTLPEADWLRRHHAMVVLLFAEAAGLAIFSAAQGNGPWHAILHALPLVPLGVAAIALQSHQRIASILVSIGLITACALLVHIWNGAIEGHFLFFVTIVVLALYEDWVPFLVAAGYVVLHHGATGALDPGAVYNHADAVAHPWKWAVIHAAFVVMAGLAAITAWRLNEDVRAASQHQALHDELTGLGNRRKLLADLERHLSEVDEARPLELLLFDLDGFKAYNDTYGHPAGDALLHRMGKRLEDALADDDCAYRMGGDEFCVLGRPRSDTEIALSTLAEAALVERGEGFEVTSSYGSVRLPAEATTSSGALRKADQRMYARKSVSSRTSAGRQSASVLLKILSERSPSLGVHLDQVTSFCEAVARKLDVPEEEMAPLLQAASLHDVGKAAIPDEILHKPGILDEEEWAFIRRHTVVGERILSEAPALTRAAKLVRSSHERFDGDGYPDNLAANEIPLGARIISVCDAYDAMTSQRPYRSPISHEQAVDELRACAGTQFDPLVVEAFVEVCSERSSEREASSL
jgi:diguanylate cyclase (GGDEF)-like protein